MSERFGLTVTCIKSEWESSREPLIYMKTEHYSELKCKTKPPEAREYWIQRNEQYPR